MSGVLGQTTKECRAVGFVELDDVERMSRMLDRPALEIVLARFESLVADTVIFHGGDVMNVSGGDAMFTSTDIDAAVCIGLDLVEQAGDDPLLPSVRVRVSYDDGPSLVLGALTSEYRSERAQKA
jgi:hypothetical protein